MIDQTTFETFTIRQKMAFFDDRIEYSHPTRKYWARHRPEVLFTGETEKTFEEMLGSIPDQLAAGYAAENQVEVTETLRFFFRAQCENQLAEELNEAVFPGADIEVSRDVSDLFLVE